MNLRENRSCFVWTEYRSWRRRLQLQATELFRSDVRRYLAEADTCTHNGDLTWLDDAYVAVREEYLDAEGYATETIPANLLFSSLLPRDENSRSRVLQGVRNSFKRRRISE